MAKAPRPTLRVIDRLAMLVAWLATCGIVYVLGYYVGQGTTERHAALEERSVRLPVTSTPPPEGQRPKEKDFPSFYQALPAGQRPIDVARGTPVTAPPDEAPAPPARSTTTLGDKPAPKPSATSTTLARTPSTTPTRATPTTTATSLPRLTQTTTTATSLPRLSPSATPATSPPPAASPPPTTVPRTTARGSFTVEASPTRSRSEAETLLGTLRRRGYDATIVQVERDGDTWYRLRVGRYATSAEATDAMRRLRDVEGVTHVFVAAE